MPSSQPLGARKVPQELAQELIVQYESLPPRYVRWRTVAGREFQTLLFTVVDEYGHTATAEALNMTRQAIGYILRQPRLRESQLTRWPSAQELEALIKAWSTIEWYRARKLIVRSDAPAFRAVQVALHALLQTFDTEIIIRATGISARRLKRFL